MTKRTALALSSKDPFERALALLEPKQQRFVREYLKERNATKAAMRAGYKRTSASVVGCRMLGKVNVAAAIHEGELKEQAEDAEYIKKLKWQVRSIVEFDPMDLHDADGDILPMDQWPPEARAAIAGIEYVMKNAEAGDGKVDRVFKLRFWSKIEASRLDYERLGLTEPQMEHGPDVPAFVFLTGGKVAIE